MTTLKIKLVGKVRKVGNVLTNQAVNFLSIKNDLSASFSLRNLSHKSLIPKNSRQCMF